MRRCKRWARSRGSGRRRTVLLCFIFYGSFQRPAHWGSRTRMPVIAVPLLHGLMWGFPKGPPAKRREPALEQSERSASAASLLAESCARAHTHLTLSLTNDYVFTKKSVYLLTDPHLWEFHAVLDSTLLRKPCGSLQQNTLSYL